MRMWNQVGIVMILLGGCGGGGSDRDGGGERDTDVCLRTCDDGVFCNGVESCSPSHPSADSDGCIDGVAPCTVGCDEAAGSCETCEFPDADGDGAASIACGGDDCDDTDDNRYPGNAELCDDIDQDCNPSTLGPDGDGDGEAALTCCNPSGDGQLCGLDCDDTRAGVHSTAVDGCGGGDEDCDGTVDEEPSLQFYLDADNDGFGDDGSSLLSCAAPDGYVIDGGDCNDANNSVHPGAPERCDGTVDDNCDGVVDEDCACTPVGRSRSCGETDVGACSYGVQRCTSDGWGTCEDDVSPLAEMCDAGGLDEDCDGDVNEGCTCSHGATRSCEEEQGVCAGGRQTCQADGEWGACSISPAMEVCDAARLDEDCDGTANEPPCLCSFGETRSCGEDGLLGNCALGVQACSAGGAWGICSIVPRSEVCGGGDEDCDGEVNEPSATDATTWYSDSDGDGFGDPGVSVRACVRPDRHVADDTDCNDDRILARPGGTELPGDGYDDDCNGWDTCYCDADDDDSRTTVVCSSIASSRDMDCSDEFEGAESDEIDCNDARALSHPGGMELPGDTHDDDCNGWDTCYRDRDGDNRRTNEVFSSHSSSGDRDMDCGDVGEAVAWRPLEWSGGTERNCCDSNADVRANQSGYFGSHDDSNGNEACGSLQWDYNCNGVESRRWTVIAANDSYPSPNSCWLDVFAGRCRVSGNSEGWVSSAPSCGGMGLWAHNCHQVGADCIFDYMSRNQECR